MRQIGEILIFIILGIVLFQAIDPTLVPPKLLRDYFISSGVEQTGAINLVSSIYLGYRVFDTLGETIVLLLSVSGIIVILKKRK